MKRKIRVAQFGIGKMGSLIVRYVLDHGGAEFVAGFARNPAQVGRDLGEVAGLAPVGVAVSDIKDAEEVLMRTKPDIAMISTLGTMELNQPIYEVCARCGVNAISIGEWCLWPYTCDAGITEKLDRLAREKGVTLSASGFPEIAWGVLATTLAAASNRVTGIKGDGMLNIDDYGPSVAELHGVGLTLEEFAEKFPEVEGVGGNYPTLPGDVNGHMADHLGVTVVRQKLKHIPLVAEEDVYCRTTKQTIPAGRVIGDYMAVISETKEGLTIEIHTGGKVYVEGDQDWNKWTIFGEPETNFIMYAPATPEITCATPVNRIPDVINAPPGYVVGSSLPINTYKARPLNEYVTAED